MDITGKSITKLNRLLLLPARDDEQDWELELADSRRIEEFIRFHDSCEELDAQDKYALVSLILGSFEDLPHQQAADVWPKLKKLLVGHWNTYVSIIIRWACLNATEEDEAYPNSAFFKNLIRDFLNDRL